MKPEKNHAMSVLPDKLKDKTWNTPHGEVTEDTLVRILLNLRTGKAPNRGVGLRSDRNWDRAAQLLRKNNLIEYTSGEGWKLCDHAVFKFEKLEEGS